MAEYDETVTPIEVKAGVRVTSKSLNVYKNNHKVKNVFRISQKNFGLQNEIKSVPLYAVFCLANELNKNI